ncbi:MAG: hypothetical protein AAF416_19970 [Pseudomonadota bacterium]
MRTRAAIALLPILFLLGPFAVLAQTAEEPAPESAPDAEAETELAPDGTPQESMGMTVQDIGAIVRRLDEDASGSPDGRMLQFTIRETVLLFVSDPIHNRMRLMTPIKAATELSEEEMLRMSQANFDSALDARYAIARGTLWSVYIHPLKELEETQFIAAIGQVVNAATSFGTSYSSGLLSFGGGDSNALRQRELIDELLKQGQPI